MNRNDEFTEWMKELDRQIPEVGKLIRKGSRRKARKKFLYQPLMGLATLVMLFVLSVNLCAPVAKAFSNVPMLKDLTKSVIFSKSLRDAIENNYVQGIELKQMKNGVTVEIVSLVVDEEKLTVFYRFESEKYKHLIAYSNVYDEEGEAHLGITEGEMTSFHTPNEEIRSVSTDYLLMSNTDQMNMDEMPEKVLFRMVVWDRQIYGDGNVLPDGINPDESEHIMTFEFLLDLNPESMLQPEYYEVNQSVELEGHKLRIRDITIYPTYMQVAVEDPIENTAKLTDLHFYVENEDGERFYNFYNVMYEIPIDKNEPVVFYFETDSPYFTDSESLKLVITGAEWMEPDKDRTCVNLATGEVRNLPEYVTVRDIWERNGKMYLQFSQQCVAMNDYRTGERIGRRISQDPFTGEYYDGEGNKYRAIYLGSSKSNEAVDWVVNDVGHMHYEECVDENGLVVLNYLNVYDYEFILTDYPYEEIWLENWYSESWRGEEEVSIVIK